MAYSKEAEARAKLLGQSGCKDDQGKLPWNLFAWDAARGIVQVLDFGARKYKARNWELGMDWSRPFDALIRHLTAWWQGENKDPETGFSHLWHAGCCLMFLIAYEMRGVGQDDRPSPKAVSKTVGPKIEDCRIEDTRPRRVEMPWSKWE